MRFRQLAHLARVLPRLGWGSLLRVARYRIELRAGWYLRRLPAGCTYAGPFWRVGQPAEAPAVRVDPALRDALLERARTIRAGRLSYFSAEPIDVGFPPAWRRAPGRSGEWPLVHWTQVAEFSAGDIKLIWEPSRFDAVPVLAAAAVSAEQASAREEAREAIETWIADWVAANPANLGPNWRCAQETALRLVNVLVADRILRSAGATNTAALCRFVAEHCQRIAPTMHYALAQDNNHATSEAVGLHLGGRWLMQHAEDPGLRSRGARWARTGRAALARCIRRLVMTDGSFSQHSVNYHRLFLATASVAEVFRREFGDPPLSDEVRALLDQAARWLVSFTDPATGDAPNLGANDGAHLLQLARAGYRDYRPHAQLAAVLFSDAAAWSDQEGGGVAADDLLPWFGLSRPRTCLPAMTTRLYEAGGYAVLVKGDLRAYMRLPVLRFRPSHSDLLHVDLWWRGRNVVRDGGSFSYNADAESLGYFPGTASHSTVQFSARDQMPRLSRFLFGAWPKMETLHVDPAASSVMCGFRDYRGAWHRRSLKLGDGEVDIEDEVAGGDADLPAVSRLRLDPAHWRMLDTGEIVDEAGAVSIAGATSDGGRPSFASGFESRLYGQRSKLTVVELRLDRLPGRTRWTLRFH